jgi:cytochrome c oxidase subunit 2
MHPDGSRWRRILLVAVAAGVLMGAAVVGWSVVLDGHVPSYGMPQGVTAQGDRTHTLWQVLFSAAIGVGVLVWVLIGWSVLRYRRRGEDDPVPSQHAYNIPVEVVYTVLPILAVIAIFVGTVFVQRQNERLAPHPDLTVEVTGFQWQWQFRYPADDVTVTGTSRSDDLPELVLPVDATTRFDLVSADVAHSFWVPTFLTKRDLIPGIDNRIDVHPTVTGRYPGRCAEFCGLDHARMDFTVRVVSQADFARWVADQKATTQ